MTRLAAVLALAAVTGCVAVTYQRAGQRITPRAEETLVFGRLSFFHDGREFFPWFLTSGSAPSEHAARVHGPVSKARETHRESGWYELQTSLSECVCLIAVFRTNTDTLESNAYARTCY